jgi:hypothetical protein
MPVHPTIYIFGLSLKPELVQTEPIFGVFKHKQTTLQFALKSLPVLIQYE